MRFNINDLMVFLAKHNISFTDEYQFLKVSANNIDFTVKPFKDVESDLMGLHVSYFSNKEQRHYFLRGELNSVMKKSLLEIFCGKMDINNIENAMTGEEIHQNIGIL
nr:hypothetical protein [uncultured Psychrobacter sp.]